MASDERRAAALAKLPAAYSLALRLRAEEVPDALVAECLGIDRSALGPLYQVAEAKLAAILGEERPE